MRSLFYFLFILRRRCSSTTDPNVYAKFHAFSLLGAISHILRDPESAARAISETSAEFTYYAVGQITDGRKWWVSQSVADDGRGLMLMKTGDERDNPAKRFVFIWLEPC